MVTPAAGMEAAKTKSAVVCFMTDFEGLLHSLLPLTHAHSLTLVRVCILARVAGL